MVYTAITNHSKVTISVKAFAWPGSAARTAAGRLHVVHRMFYRRLPGTGPVKSLQWTNKPSLQYFQVQCDSRGVAKLQTTVEQLSVRVPTVEARSSLRFTLLPSGQGQAVVVSAVAEGSSAAQAGVQRGMKLTAISDPIRRDEVWELQERPSLRYIRDVMRMRSSDFIELGFTTDQALLEALNASEGLVSLTSSSSSTPTSSIGSLDSVLGSVSDTSDTVAERLQQQFDQAQAAVEQQNAVQQRQQRRKEYMEQVGQRNDNTFVAIAASAFLLPAAAILLVAYFSGYLDNLYSDSLTNMR